MFHFSKRFCFFPVISVNLSARSNREGFMIISRELSPSEFNSECSISLERFEALAAKGNLVATQWNHKFSKLALENWLLKSHTCPLCRSDIEKNSLAPVALKAIDVAKPALSSSARSKKIGREGPVQKKKQRVAVETVESVKKLLPKIRKKELSFREAVEQLGLARAPF
jgi:hypothetical protein